MSQIKIEKNVPLPVQSSSTVPALPLDKMEIGDSFRLELEQRNDISVIRQRLYRFQKANSPKHFAVRTEGGNVVRVYRVEDSVL